MTALRVFSCGAGVQSSAIALLMHEGRIPMPDHAIFADTGDEPPSVYETLGWIEELFAGHGVPLHRVSRGGSLTGDVLDPYVFATLPAFTEYEVEHHKPVAWRLCDCGWGALRRSGGFERVWRLFEGLDKEEGEYHFYYGRHVDALIDELEEPAAEQLRDAGLDFIPLPHDCDFGRVATAWHEYTTTERGKILRQCTGKYKIEPVERLIRELAGAPVTEQDCRFCDGTGERVPPWAPDLPPGMCSVCRGARVRRRVGSVPDGASVTQLIGFSTDEITRVKDTGYLPFVTPNFPLLDLELSRADCEAVIRRHGKKAAKSACIQCPYHDNAFWRTMRDERPDEWAAAVAFDHAFRTAPGLRARRYLHPSCKPLDEAPIDTLSARELAALQGELFAGPELSCSPYACPSDLQTDDGLPVSLGMPEIRGAA